MSKKTTTTKTKPAPVDVRSGTIEIGGKVYQVKGHATLPTFKIAENEPRIFLIDGEMILKEKRDKNGPKLDDQGNPSFLHVVKVVNPETGEVGQIVCGAVLVRAFKEYPGGYVGKTFALTKHPGEPGKAKQWSVVEVA